MATTLVISDLHLGGRTGADVLRREAARAPLLEVLTTVDRLVLLGDVLELRHGPIREALANARPFFDDVARALPEHAEIVVIAGNHDHQLVVPWLDRRGRSVTPPKLELEHRIVPARASWAAGQLARWLGEERTSVAYPGVWLRPDVYAMHGNLMDLFSTLPNFERLGAAITTRVMGGNLREGDSVDEFLARLEPVYAWADAVARHSPAGGRVRGANAGARTYELLAGSGPRPLRARVLAGAFPLIIGALNRVGLGPLSPNLAGDELRRSALRAMDEVVTRLRLDVQHVIFGHSHRAGPLPGDDLAEWRTATGAQLHNSGCWVFETHFLAGPDSASPYWPGTAIRLGDEGPPLLERLLTDVGPTDLAGPEPDPAG